MTREEELLVEKALTAHRRRAPDGAIVPSGAWADLGAEGRRAVFEAARALRALEAAIDDKGLSSTARAVLGRIASEGR